MDSRTRKPWNRRRGVVAVLSAILIVAMLGMVAFAVDVGYMSLVKTQLQAAADASALAAAARIGQNDMVSVAQDIAGRNTVAGRAVQLDSADVVTGVWDAEARTFTPSATTMNAVKATVRTGSNYGGSTGLFFAKIFGISSVDQQASAVATVNPRDIAFVVDLSGSMNDDTEPFDSSANTTAIQNIYNDFNFGAYPGTLSSLSSNKSTQWNMTNVIKPAMPNATPTANTASSVSVNYWESYISYCKDNNYKAGYKTYLQFMLDKGRAVKPDDVNYTPLSVNNTTWCPYHTETTDMGDFSFPPREMPTHACRRAIIAALAVVQSRNALITNSSQRDWVSIVVFDYKNTAQDTTHVRIAQSLTDNYMAAANVARLLQACDDDGSCTDTEGGMILAKNHIKAASQGGAGREKTNKVIVLLTDGMPNLYESSSSTISAYMTANPGGWGSGYAQNGALMQSHMGQVDGWFIYPVGVGGGADQSFMNKMSVKAGTAVNGTGFPIASDSTAYENQLKTIFTQIITNPKLRLVQ